jgi:hypothetical protein
METQIHWSRLTTSIHSDERTDTDRRFRMIRVGELALITASQHLAPMHSFSADRVVALSYIYTRSTIRQSESSPTVLPLKQYSSSSLMQQHSTLIMPADRKSPSKARKPPASPRKKPETLEVSLPTPPVLYSTPVANTLFYSILIKTLSHALAKNIDWHQMSKNIASEMEELDISTTSKSKAKGKGKAKQTDEPAAAKEGRIDGS